MHDSYLIVGISQWHHNNAVNLSRSIVAMGLLQRRKRRRRRRKEGAERRRRWPGSQCTGSPAAGSSSMVPTMSFPPARGPRAPTATGGAPSVLRVNAHEPASRDDQWKAEGLNLKHHIIIPVYDVDTLN